MKNKIDDFLIVVIFASIFMIIGAAFGRLMESNTGVDSIDKQHMALIISNPDFKYCPYCGERLENNL